MVFKCKIIFYPISYGFVSNLTKDAVVRQTAYNLYEVWPNLHNYLGCWIYLLHSTQLTQVFRFKNCLCVRVLVRNPIVMIKEVDDCINIHNFISIIQKHHTQCRFFVLNNSRAICCFQWFYRFFWVASLDRQCLLKLLLI